MNMPLIAWCLRKRESIDKRSSFGSFMKTVHAIEAAEQCQSYALVLLLLQSLAMKVGAMTWGRSLWLNYINSSHLATENKSSEGRLSIPKSRFNAVVNCRHSLRDDYSTPTYMKNRDSQLEADESLHYDPLRTCNEPEVALIQPALVAKQAVRTGRVVGIVIMLEFGSLSQF